MSRIIFFRKMSTLGRIVIFGSSGNTGLAVLEEGLKKGYELVAFVRDSSKLPENVSNQVTVIEGDVLNKRQVSDAIQGCSAVIVTLGTRNELGPTTVMSEGTRNITAAMKQHGLKRISVCISAFIFFESDRVPSRFQEINADHLRQLQVLKDSELDWIAVCPPHITDDLGKGNYCVMLNQSPGRIISKFDLADFLVQCLSISDHLQSTVGIGYKTIENK